MTEPREVKEIEFGGYELGLTLTKSGDLLVTVYPRFAKADKDTYAVDIVVSSDLHIHIV